MIEQKKARDIIDPAMLNGGEQVFDGVAGTVSLIVVGSFRVCHADSRPYQGQTSLPTRSRKFCDVTDPKERNDNFGRGRYQSEHR